MIFYGKIENGKLSIINSQRVKKDISIKKDGIVEIKIRYRNQRSNNQNRYYWGVVVWEIRRKLVELGNEFDDEDVHWFLKDKFNSRMVVGVGGELLGQKGASTTAMNKDEFGDYIERIARWAGEFLGLFIPPPGSELSIDF